MKNESHLQFRLPIGTESEQDYARTLRENLEVLVGLAMNPVVGSQYLEPHQLKTVNFVTRLIVELSEIEDKPKAKPIWRPLFFHDDLRDFGIEKYPYFFL
ncbi:MAG: hypothetical protein AAF998_18360 [Bacteroidota bacterium]